MIGKKRKITLIVLVASTLTIYLIMRFFVTAPPQGVPVPPSIQLLESRIVGRKDGVRQWEILAQSVLQAEDIVTLAELDEIVMYQDREPHLLINAVSATWERKKDILHLYESQVRNVECDFYLESDLLVWSGGSEILDSPGPVFILWDGLKIRAGEMKMETANNLLYLNDDVQIRDGSMLWKMQSAVYDLDHEHLDFYGDIFLEEEQEHE